MTRTTRRRFLIAAAATAAAPLTSAFSAPRRQEAKPSDLIRVGVIGVRGRGRAHIGGFKDSPHSEVVAICDPDEGVIAPAMKAVPEAKYYRDLRKMLDDPTIDAVSIATPNHWHSLAAIWALQAGKHVYVEKPVSHNIFEGRQVVNAAKRYGKIVQHGTQARTQPATQQAMAFLHEGGLGEVRLAHGLCYKPRESIGKVDGPQDPPETCDYDLWTGPAEMQPLMRQSLHYDWHWVFNTGNGDIGNQGVHQTDIARWGLGLTTHPQRIVSCGGRLGYEDDGNTPNTLVTLLDYGDKEIIFEVRGLKTPPFHGAGIGVVFFGEKGTLVSGSYNKVQAFDHDGQVLETFEGDADHYQNFLDAIRAGDAGVLNAPIDEGHLSASICHLGTSPTASARTNPSRRWSGPSAARRPRVTPSSASASTWPRTASTPSNAGS
ncbi:MAG: Gfo/Idh/MocA family oxidoreductase [Planctomycetota bacterium]